MVYMYITAWWWLLWQPWEVRLHPRVFQYPAGVCKCNVSGCNTFTGHVSLFSWFLGRINVVFSVIKGYQNITCTSDSFALWISVICFCFLFLSKIYMNIETCQNTKHKQALFFFSHLLSRKTEKKLALP